MKIGIYGDSFACPKSSRQPKINTDMPWMSILEKSGNHDITNFALSGTSLYWSYNIYKENHTKFDKNIFVATSPGRLYIPWNSDRQHWTPVSVTNKIHSILNENCSLFNEVSDYFLKIYNYKEHQTYKELMLKNISTDDNILIIDTVDKLSRLSAKEHTYLTTDPDLIDNRWCHMSQEGNNFLAERIKIWLETNNFNIDDWEKSCPMPSIEKKSSYFVKVI